MDSWTSRRRDDTEDHVFQVGLERLEYADGAFGGVWCHDE